MKAVAARTTPVFCYGSNSARQIAQRIRRRGGSLRSSAAFLPGFRRVFVGEAASWNGSAVASIAPLPGIGDLGKMATALSPNPDTAVFGSIVHLTDAELAMLDGYEGCGGPDDTTGVYRRAAVPGAFEVHDPPGGAGGWSAESDASKIARATPCQGAIAYVRNSHAGEALPSEAYLKACEYVPYSFPVIFICFAKPLL